MPSFPCDLRQLGGSSVATEAFQKNVISASYRESQFNFGRTGNPGGDHALLNIPSDFGFEKEPLVNRLDEGAFSAFVRPPDQGARIIKLNGQVTMHPVAANRLGQLSNSATCSPRKFSPPSTDNGIAASSGSTGSGFPGITLR